MHPTIKRESVYSSGVSEGGRIKTCFFTQHVLSLKSNHRSSSILQMKLNVFQIFEYKQLRHPNPNPNRKVVVL